tara:strand:+ start:721 stop:1029 length:309 start_codon:yes stop_codon:yes gene_type:complete
MIPNRIKSLWWNLRDRIKRPWSKTAEKKMDIRIGNMSGVAPKGIHQPAMKTIPERRWVRHMDGTVEFVNAGQKVPETSRIMTQSEIADAVAEKKKLEGKKNN